MQGECSSPGPSASSVAPRPPAGACEIKVQGSFLQVDSREGPLWLSNLHVVNVVAPSGRRLGPRLVQQETLLVTYGADLYVTGSVLQGDGVSSSAMEAAKRGRLFTSGVPAPPKPCDDLL